jgi:hypothetical protein
MRSWRWRRLIPARLAVSPILQRSQKLDLQMRRDLSDLVEKQSSPMRELEVPLARSRGLREGSCLVTEHLALDQPLGKRRAVNRHERRSGLRGAATDRATPVPGPFPSVRPEDLERSGPPSVRAGHVERGVGAVAARTRPVRPRSVGESACAERPSKSRERHHSSEKNGNQQPVAPSPRSVRADPYNRQLLSFQSLSRGWASVRFAGIVLAVASTRGRASTPRRMFRMTERNANSQPEAPSARPRA